MDSQCSCNGDCRSRGLPTEVQDFFDSAEAGIILLKEVEVPGVLQPVLGPYQRTGFQWLVNNMRDGIGFRSVGSKAPAEIAACRGAILSGRFAAIVVSELYLSLIHI